MSECEFCKSPRSVDATPCPSCAAEPTTEWLNEAGVPATVFGSPDVLLGDEGFAALDEAFAQRVAPRENDTTPIRALTVSEELQTSALGQPPPDTRAEPADHVSSPAASTADHAPGAHGSNTLMQHPGRGVPKSSSDSETLMAPSVGGLANGADTAMITGVEMATAEDAEKPPREAPTQMLQNRVNVPRERPRAAAVSSGVPAKNIPSPVLSDVGSVTLDTSARELVRFARTIDPDDPASVLKVQALLEQIISQQESEAVPRATERTLSTIGAVLSKEPLARPKPAPDSVSDFAVHLMNWAREASASDSSSTMMIMRDPDGSPTPSGRIEQSLASLTATLEASASDSMMIGGEVDAVPDAEPGAEQSQPWDSFDGLGIGGGVPPISSLAPASVPGVPAPLDGGRVTDADGRVRVAMRNERLAAQRRNGQGVTPPAAEPEVQVDALADARPNRPDRFSQQAQAAEDMAVRAPALTPPPVVQPTPGLAPPSSPTPAEAGSSVQERESPLNARVLGAVVVGVLFGAIIMWLFSR